MLDTPCSPFTELASMPYVMVQAQGNSSKTSSPFEGRRAASAQPLSLDFCNYSMTSEAKVQRCNTAAAYSVDELIASFAGKPLPYESAAAASDSSEIMLEPVAEEFGWDAEQDQSPEQQLLRPSSSCFNNQELSPAVQAVLEQYAAAPIGSGCTTGIANAAQQLIWESHIADTFYAYDLGEVARLYHTWCATMPRVKPFYAVKCNPDPGMVAMLNALGAGFDCASIQELERAAAHNVPQDRVIFANPCKRPADFRYAAEKGVEYTTFDCASELEKIAAWYPSFKCVLRIRCDDSEAKINLGLKYGADMSDVPYLLQQARSLGLQVVGVSFHVGSGCQNVGVYAEAIESARQAFDAAAALGYEMTLLDIGGGFTAPYNPETAELFRCTADVINTAIDKHFPADCGVRIIAEPGRYFAETSATLFTTILGQRALLDSEEQEFRDYWLSDGTYGSFRILVAVDGLEPNYSVLRSPLLPEPSAQEADYTPCRLWGNDDGEGDCVQKLARLPRLRNGDWLMFPYMGAYTICSASNYGGMRMTEPLKLYVYSEVAPREGGMDMGVAGGLKAADLQQLESGGAGSSRMECEGDMCSNLSDVSEETAVGEAMEVSSVRMGN